MPADNTAYLSEAARSRTRQSRDRTVAAIRRLDHEGHDITVAAVSRAAGVSRSFLYRHADLRAEIERLRPTQPTASRLPSQLRGSPDSTRARAEALRSEIERLTTENRWLRQQAETLLGERRAAPHPQP
jgi:hypothetical protein